MVYGILFIIGAIMFLFVASAIYKVMRRVMIGDTPTLSKCAAFVFVYASVIVPGFIMAHPPPIPVPIPGAALFLGLVGLLQGQSDFIWMNLGGWMITAAYVAFIEALDAIPHSPAASENDASLSLQDRQQEKTTTWGRNLPDGLVAEFVRSVEEQTSYHRAEISRDGDDLVLSLYEGEQPQSLALLHTHVAHDWEELDAFLRLKTNFRKSDFHVSN